MISVVCVYNDEKILDDFLAKSLRGQTVEYEFIKIDNTGNQFSSAAKALNFGGAKAKGKYILFAHQDVDLSSESWLREAENILDAILGLGIAGVMGVCERGDSKAERLRNVVRHDWDQRQIGNPIAAPELVQTLDEVSMIIPKEVFKRYQFDEQVCDDWHLYGVDYCLTMGVVGLGVYAIPMFIRHKSGGASIGAPLYSLRVILNLGPMVKEYYRTLDKVLKKHKRHYRWIYTTCGHGKWNTYEPLLWQRAAHLLREYSKGMWKRLGKLFKVIWP